MHIIATVWKKPLDLQRVGEMIDAGATILRIKFAHGGPEDAIGAVRQLQAYIKEREAAVAVMLDMPEEKIRLGGISAQKEKVVPQRVYTVKSGATSESFSDFIPIQLENIKNYFTVGEHIFFGDGELEAVIEDMVSDDEMKIRFLQGGTLVQFRGVFSARLADSFDHSQPVIKALPLLGDVRPEYIALSFVGNADYIKRVQAAIAQQFNDTWHPKIMAKIESPAGLEHLEEIADHSDMLIVARGDLALTHDFRKLIMEQKRMCRVGRAKGKPVIVATQILDSCLQNVIPVRSDIADVTNIVLDGADGVWFSQATAHNEHPGHPIRLFKEIAEAVKNYHTEI